MSSKITFSDLISKVAEKTGASKQFIHDLLKEMGSVVKEGLGRDGRVRIKGLGYFKLKWIKTRSGRNPQTGETIEIPAHNKVNFRPELSFRRYINRKYKDLKPTDIIGKIEEDLAFVGKEQEPTEIVKPEHSAAQTERKVGKTKIVTEPILKQPERKNILRKIPVWLWLAGIILIVIIVSFILVPWKTAKPVSEQVKVSESIVEETESETKKPELESVEPTPLETGISGGQHIVRPGDKLWVLAQDYYQEAYLWPNIFRVNPDKINNPDSLVTGINITVPPLEGKIGSLTEKDIKDVAEGYLLVYLVYKQLGKEKAYYYLWVTKCYDVSDLISQFRDKIEGGDINLVTDIGGSPEIK
jgi:DNA-binding protein HU-beta